MEEVPKMLRRSTRFLFLLAVALVAGILATGSFALADDDRDGSSHQRSTDHYDSEDHHDHDSDDHDSDDRHDGRHHHGHHGDHGHHHGRKCCHRHGSLSGLDHQWLKRHIQTNLFEIAGGQAAQSRATTDEVRDLAARLVAEHTAALEEATALAERLRVKVPTTPSPLQQWALRAVATFSGSDFDRWFTELQVDGHAEAILETRAEVVKGCNRKVRRLAAATLPVLEEHLEHAQAILAD
jgi:putative membrane protein